MVVFFLSAAVQYNDDDAMRWASIYIAAFAMCVLFILKKLPKWLPLALIIISSCWILVLLPEVVGVVSLSDVVSSLQMKTKEIEEAREIGGLCLVAMWSTVIYRRQQTKL